MIETILGLGPWAWIIAGAILLALELVAPGAFMMWLGLAALLVGVISFLVAWPWQAQGIAFAVFAIASVPLWRRFALKVEMVEPPVLNRRGDALIGRVFTLQEPIVNGAGTVPIDDTIWRVTSAADAPAGSRVRVISSQGASLTVEPAA
jgi:membrane protein implicated in regulation of membrane protease activity